VSVVELGYDKSCWESCAKNLKDEAINLLHAKYESVQFRELWQDVAAHHDYNVPALCIPPPITFHFSPPYLPNVVPICSSNNSVQLQPGSF
jgi:hypothetical protein